MTACTPTTTTAQQRRAWPRLSVPHLLLTWHRWAPLGTAGDAPVGLSPPHKNECPGLAGGGAIRGQGKADASDCADLAAECKPLATLRARLALAGWVLATTPGNPHGAFTASRWGMTRDLQGLAAVAAFTDRVGAP